jgi:2-methylfumaryl-CoA isomerase
MNNHLLHGTRVLESSAFIAAPLAGLTLAQFGADVIRIEMIGGGIDYGRLPVKPGGRSLYWTGLNKGKRSIAIDLRRPEGRELVREIVTAPGEGGGILLTNIVVPWLAHSSLAGKRPDLISCTIEGNADGSTAVDYTVNSAAGFPAITGGGSPEHPVNNVVPAWDIACAFQAAFAIAAAIANRRAIGEGAELRLALSDVAFTMLSHLGYLAEVEVLGQDRPSLSNYVYGAFGRDFATSDGRRIFVAAISLGQWRGLVKACGLEQNVAALEALLGQNFDREADRYEAREAIALLVEEWCGARKLDEIATIYNETGVCWGPYHTVRSLLQSDPRVSAANPVFGMMETAGVGSHLAAGTPVRSPGLPAGELRPAPLLGQDTDAILLDVLKLDSAVVGRLHDVGIVAGPDSDPLTSVTARSG